MSLTDDRNTVERIRLRIKRRDPQYLATQRANRAAQMAATRARRRASGLCRECERPRLKGLCYCRAHLLYERNRTDK